MAEQVSFVQESFDRFNEAYRSLDEGVQRLQKQLQTRRRNLEKQLTAGRKSFEKQVASGRRTLERRTRKQIDELLKSPVARRARSLRSEAARQLESRVDGVLGYLQIASKSDLRRIDRKVSQLSRRLKDFEGRKRGNGTTATAS